MERRILFLSKFFSTGFGGTPEAILLLARHLGTLSVETDVLCRKGIHRNVGNIRHLPGRDEVPMPAGVFLDLTVYEAVFVVGAWNPHAVALIPKLCKYGIPLIYCAKGSLCRVEFQNLKSIKKLPYLSLIEMWPIILADCILFTSELERREFILPWLLKIKKHTILPEIVDEQKLQLNQHPRMDGQMRLGFIAQASRRKGLKELVEGFLAWLDDRPHSDIQLVIAGTAVNGSESYWNTIHQIVNDHPLGRNISFLGQVSGLQKIQFYENIDAIVIPSHFESFGLGLLEALWHGRPILAGSNLGALEYTADCPSILTMPEISSEAVMAGLDQLWSNWEQLELKAKSMRGVVIQTLAGERVGLRLLEIIQEVLNPAPLKIETD